MSYDISTLIPDGYIPSEFFYKVIPVPFCGCNYTCYQEACIHTSFYAIEIQLNLVSLFFQRLLVHSHCPTNLGVKYSINNSATDQIF
jgi:hypothetical protein